MADWSNPIGDTSNRIYPSSPWKATNWFLNLYTLKGKPAIHTGDDINLPGATDIGEEVHAVGAGTVVFADFIEESSWMGLVVIRHDHDGTFTCSRYGHLTEISVSKDDTVEAGQLIAKIAQPNEFAPFEAHLHFDIGKTGDQALLDNPPHWPKSTLTEDQKRALVLKHYQNPAGFLQPRLQPLTPGNEFRIVVGKNGLNIRSSRSTASGDNIVGWLHRGAVVQVKAGGGVVGDDGVRVWLEITDGRGFVAEELTALFDPSAIASDEIPQPVSAVTTRKRGVNINLDIDVTSPPDLIPLGYCRFVYDLSQGQGNQEFSLVFDRYDAKIRAYINQNVTPIAILNHEFFGEGAGFNWDEMRQDNPGTREKWLQLSHRLAELAAELAGHYGDQIVYQIWNEADQASVAAVGVPEVSLAAMTDKCLERILAVAPHARVITSGLVSGDPGYWRRTRDAMQRSNQLAGVALHAYGRGPQGHPARFQQFGKTRDLVNAYAQISPQHKFWITEWGVTGDPSKNEPPNVPVDSVADYIEAFLDDIEADPRVESIVYFAYADGQHNTFGLSKSDGTRKQPVWSAMTSV